MTENKIVQFETIPQLKLGFSAISLDEVDIINKYIDDNTDRLPDLSSQLVGQIKQNEKSNQLEFDLNDKKQKEKQLPKLKKQIGKYFYDPYDGKIKLLTEQNGVLGFVDFNSVADITFGDLPGGVSTETSTPYQDEVEAREQEKSEGVLADEDIAAIRGY